MLDGSLESLAADRGATHDYLSLSDLMIFIEETMIANPNQREIELSSNGLKVASHAG